MKKTIISIVLLTNILISAQSALDMSKALTNNIKSPQVTDFIRYGNIPIKKNIGELDLSIPLLSIPTQDGADITVGLGYNACGFIPSKNASAVGFNWELLAGGIITREVRGEADDQLGSPGTLDASGQWRHFEHGFIAGIKQFGTNTSQMPTDNDLLNYNYNKIDLKLDDNLPTTYYEVRFKGNTNDVSTQFETTPDMFSFSFNGISGKFFMAPNGNIEVTTTEPHFLKVDVTNFTPQPYVMNCTPKYNSEIKMTDEKGNEYYFGGESKNLEYSVLLNSEGGESPNTMDTPIINAWRLTKVVFSNGEILKYNYADDKINFSTSSTFCKKESGFWHPNADNTITKKFLEIHGAPVQIKRLNDTYQEAHTMSYTQLKSTSSNESLSYSYSVIKKAYLSSIEYKDYKVNFVYSAQDNLYKNMIISSPFIVLAQQKLDKIELYNKNNFIKDVSFSYENYNTNFPRIFLKQILETGKNPYILKYDISNASNTPNPLTLALDYWGYYNGRHSNEQSFPPVFIPKATYYQNGDLEYTSNNREPDFNFAKMYALKSIQYPTGGYSNFEYEPHFFSLKLDRKLSSEFLPSLFPVIGGVAGGTRIKKIYDVDIFSKQNIKEFTYLNDTDQSSGILLDWPRYYFYMNSQTSIKLCDPPGSNKCWASMDTAAFDGYIQSSTYSKNLFEGSVMSYSKVLEKQTGNGSITDYYTSYIDKPDTFFDNKRVLTAGSFTPSPATTHINLLPADRSIERGKLSRRLIKDENNNLLEETNILYNEDPNRFNKFHFAVQHSTAWANTTKNYFYNDFTSKTTSKKYFNGDVVTTESNFFYDYNLHNMLVKTSVKQPNNTIQESTYKYSPEVGNLYLKDKNIVGILLEDKTVRKNDVNDPGKIVSLTQSIYPISQSEADTKTSGLPLPYSVTSTDLQNTTKEEVSYDKYDNKGNLQQYTNKDGISTTIIWGYNQTKPIAKVEGAKLMDISSSLITDIVNASDTDASAPKLSDESSFYLTLDNFRKDSSLANYLITTYTYDPLIGIRSITPPSGIKEVYKYDTANRLERIVDTYGKIIKEYNYNYAPIRYYNSEKSQSFTKNNCGSGMLSNPLTYNVPANYYTSIISQADADQQAQNEINANGQNMANTNGVCYYPYCVFNSQSSSSIIMMQYAPFEKVNTVVNAQFNFQVINNQGVNWNNDIVQLGNIPSPCWPIATVTKTSGNWQVTILPASGQTVLRWIGTGSPSTGTPYNITFNYNVY
jgi:hypothetical protein